ncbi:MAG: hypothetical protein CSA68_05530 [Rhodobacterales bacterium]|nr:MAG: hypothetical protein CSA68_05530 [Rhodobacterales bacterium]
MHDRNDYPALGRLFGWVDKPGSANKIFVALAVVCLLLFMADFTYEKHGHFSVEHIPGFFGFYGFIMFTGLIFAATGLRVLVKRREDFYGDKAVDREDYPESGLQKVDYDD